MATTDTDFGKYLNQYGQMIAQQLTQNQLSQEYAYMGSSALATLHGLTGGIMGNLYDTGTTAKKNRLIKFFRINEADVVEEGSKGKEPLDELRIKVARWLDKN